MAEDRKLNVFISYSRDDLDFADQLDAGLGISGFDTTVDRHGISAGEDWKSRLGALIRDADTIVFVLSPSSVRSETCAWEVSTAVELGKRILPVVCRSIEGASSPAQLAALNYIYFYAEPRFPGSGFGTGLVGLVTALNTDLDWLREHTRYLQRASEWAAGPPPRSTNRLLSGPDIEAAKAWEARRPKSAPEPTALQREFIKASEAEALRQMSAEAQRLKEMAEAQDERARALAEREAAQAREAEAQKREVEAQKQAAAEAKRVASRTRLGFVVAMVLAGFAAWFAWNAHQQRTEAENERQKAYAERDNAFTATKAANAQRDRALLQESRTLAIFAREAIDAGKQPTAMLLALEALPDPAFGGERPLSFEAAGLLYLAWLRNRETTLAGHLGPVHSAAFSPDGTHVVTASTDKTARVWDLRSERPTFLSLQHPDDVTSAAFSPDGTRVLTASKDGTTRVWDQRAERPRFVVLEGGKSPVTSASFSKDGTKVLTVSAGSAWVWDLGGERPTFIELKGDGSLVLSASFSADRSHVVTALSNGTARVWDLRDDRPSFIVLGTALPAGSFVLFASASFNAEGTKVVACMGAQTRVWDLRGEEPIAVPLESGRAGTLMGTLGQAVRAFASFDANGTHVVTASGDGMGLVWDLSGDRPTFVALEGHTDVISAAFSADSTHVVTVSSDRSAWVWDLRISKDPIDIIQGRKGPRVIAKLAGHRGSISSASFSADGAHVVTASDDGSARVWDLRGDRPSFFVLEGASGQALSADGAHVLTTSATGARVWDLRGDRPNFVALEGAHGPFDYALFSASGTHLLTASGEALRVWDLHGDLPTFVALEGKGRVLSASFSADDTHLLTASADGTRVWNLRDGQSSFIAFEGHRGPILSASFSADGTHVLAASVDDARVWDLRGEQPGSVALEGQLGRVVSTSFSADGTHVLTVSEDAVRLWDLRGERPNVVALVEGRDPSVRRSATFSPDGTRVVTASKEGVRLWDLRAEPPRFVALDNDVRSATFSPDGTRVLTVVTSSVFGDPRLWDLRGEQPHFVSLDGVALERPERAVVSAAFSPAGTHVVMISSDHTVGVWRMFPNVSDLIRLVRTSLSGCLAEVQRDAYGLHTEHAAENRTFIPPPTADGRCPR
jgi:WD40 repeat protein